MQKLSRLAIGGDAGTPSEAIAALVQSYIDCARRTAQLEQHAELAPQRYSADALRHLASGEGKQRERLRQALDAAGAGIPSVSSGPPPRGALNHWTRLLQDLEAHRSSTQRLRELAIRFAETFPQTAGLFDELRREEVLHCEDLRSLVARADPQALD
ncbi:MAG: hypothetical protein ACHQ9S_16630 [Candidatus Binatia bacterium]